MMTNITYEFRTRHRQVQRFDLPIAPVIGDEVYLPELYGTAKVVSRRIIYANQKEILVELGCDDPVLGLPEDKYAINPDF